MLQDFIEGLDLTAYRVAKDTGMDPTAIYAILKGKRSITAETAIRFGQFFDTTPLFWLNLQNNFDLEVARRKMAMA